MDIRNFFGNKPTSQFKKKVITEDEDETNDLTTPTDNSFVIQKQMEILKKSAFGSVKSNPKVGVKPKSSEASPLEDSDDETGLKTETKNDLTLKGKPNLSKESEANTKAEGDEEVIAPITNFLFGKNNLTESAISKKTKVGSVPYALLVDTFEEVSKVSGKIDKTNLFAKLFKHVIENYPSDLETVVYLASNQVYPAYYSMELGIGDALLIAAVCEATGRTADAVKEDYKREGSDLGKVALISRSSQKTLSFLPTPKALLASHVLDQFRLLCEVKGKDARSRKVSIIKAMMVRCQGNEAKYLVRALQGKLRIGTATTYLVSLAHAFAESPPASVRLIIDEEKQKLSNSKGNKNAYSKGSNSRQQDENEEVEEDNGVIESKAALKLEIESGGVITQSNGEKMLELLESVEEVDTPEAVQLYQFDQISKEKRNELAEIAVKRAFSECPNLAELIDALLKYPLYRLFRHCQLKVGLPVAPMLAKPTKEINEVLKRLSGLAFTMEYKYDGERAQVHLLPDGTVKIFSRNSEDNTEKFSDLKDIIRRARVHQVQSCIIDAEVVAYDREKGCLLPFQVLSTRKRKVESGEEDNQKVKIVLQVFDLLYLNGKSLLRESFRTRRSLLQFSFTHDEGLFHFATGSDHIEDGDTLPIESFLTEACGAMSEGLMVKTLDYNASYEPSKRSMNWLKLKKDYIDGMGVCDSIDCVVIGAYKGRGKRMNVYGAYLVACYDPEKDEFQSICKVGTGFTDENLQRLFQQFQQYILDSDHKPHNYNVGDSLHPDHWFSAAVVWEIQAADLSKSSAHKGGYGRLEAGRGIGLRFPRYLRDREDKKPENATSAEQIVEMYFSQGGVEGNAINEVNDDEEDDWEV